MVWLLSAYHHLAPGGWTGSGGGTAAAGGGGSRPLKEDARNQLGSPSFHNRSEGAICPDAAISLNSAAEYGPNCLSPFEYHQAFSACLTWVDSHFSCVLQTTLVRPQTQSIYAVLAEKCLTLECTGRSSRRMSACVSDNSMAICFQLISD